MGSEYEWVQHAAIAEAVGGSAEQVRAVEAGDLDSALFSEAQRAVLRFTSDVIERRPPASEGMEPRKVVELLMVIGHYTGIALLLEAAAIETDPPARLGR